jgi:hypothetical protein
MATRLVKLLTAQPPSPGSCPKDQRPKHKHHQQQSPQASPAKANPFSDINVTGDDVDVSLTPVKLGEKLNLLQGKKNLTPYQASQIVGDKEWKGEMIFHKDIVRELYGEQHYVFVRQEKLSIVNLDLIKKDSCKRAAKCKVPASSKQVSSWQLPLLHQV